MIFCFTFVLKDESQQGYKPKNFSILRTSVGFFISFLFVIFKENEQLVLNNLLSANLEKYFLI